MFHKIKLFQIAPKTAHWHPVLYKSAVYLKLQNVNLHEVNKLHTYHATLEKKRRGKNKYSNKRITWHIFKK